MKIKSDSTNIEYEVKWRPYGISSAVPIVYEYRKTRFFGIRKKKVWQGKSNLLISAESMLPKDMQRWFERAVRDYETYILEWTKFRNER